MSSRRKHKLKPIFNPFSDKKGTNESGRKKQAAIAIALLATSTAIWFLTPASSIVAVMILLTIPIHEDLSLGRESWKQMQSKYSYQIIPDRWDISAIGDQLVTKIENGQFCKNIALDFQQCKLQMRKYRWSFQVVSSPEVNAFALPGGIIRVTDSLLRRLRPTEGEIAALLGHEMGHILHRHGQVKLLKKNLLNTMLKALVYEDGDDDQESFGEAVGEILLSGSLFLGEMRFSRQDEYEADAAAFDILADSDIYHPKSVQSLLEKLGSLSGQNNGQREISWDKTHPGTAERIDALTKLWDNFDWHEKRKFSSRKQ